MISAPKLDRFRSKLSSLIYNLENLSPQDDDSALAVNYLLKDALWLEAQLDGVLEEFAFNSKYALT